MRAAQDLNPIDSNKFYIVVKIPGCLNLEICFIKETVRHRKTVESFLRIYVTVYYPLRCFIAYISLRKTMI